jgi:hypothetical protein
LVLRQGGNATLKDKDGRTAQDLARHLLRPEETYGLVRGHELKQIIRLLEGRGT